MSDRLCVLCGTPLNGQRPDARHCGEACRREASRIRAVLAGEPVDGHASLASYGRRGRHSDSLVRVTVLVAGAAVRKGRAEP